MENFKFAADGAWQVLVYGLILGAGLPAVFAVGVRMLAVGSSDVAVEGQAPRTGNAGARAVAFVCFAVVILAVALGITEIVAGGLHKSVSFEHVYPTLKAK